MIKIISKEIQEQIPILYSEINNKTQVAKQLGISVATVNHYLSLYEGAVAAKPKPKKQKTRVTEEEIAKMNELYEKYHNVKKVAEEIGRSTTTVANHLNIDNLKEKQKLYDERDALFYYIYNLFGQYSEEEPVSSWNLIQMQKFRNQGINYSAQLLILKYWYEVRKKPIKNAKGSIGIIPYIYNDASNYYKNQIKKMEEFKTAAMEQLEKDRITIKFNPNDYFGKKKKKKLIDLESIESGEN